MSKDEFKKLSRGTVAKIISHYYESQLPIPDFIKASFNYEEHISFDFHYADSKHEQNIIIQEINASNIISTLPMVAYQELLSADWIGYSYRGQPSVMQTALYRKNYELVNTLLDLSYEKVLKEPNNHSYHRTFEQQVLGKILDIDSCLNHLNGDKQSTPKEYQEYHHLFHKTLVIFEEYYNKKYNSIFTSKKDKKELSFKNWHVMYRTISSFNNTRNNQEQFDIELVSNSKNYKFFLEAYQQYQNVNDEENKSKTNPFHSVKLLSEAIEYNTKAFAFYLEQNIFSKEDIISTIETIFNHHTYQIKEVFTSSYNEFQSSFKTIKKQYNNIQKYFDFSTKHYDKCLSLLLTGDQEFNEMIISNHPHFLTQPVYEKLTISELAKSYQLFDKFLHDLQLSLYPNTNANGRDEHKTKIISTYNNFDLFVAGKMSEIIPVPKLSLKQEEKAIEHAKSFLSQIQGAQAYEKFDTFIFQEKLNNQLKSGSNSISMKTKI